MIQWLTYIGLAVVPFIIANGGGRYPKEFVATGIAAAIGFWALSQATLKPVDNKFIFITILVMLFGTAFVPVSGVVLGLAQQGTFIMDNRLDIDNLWNYKPILYAIIYLLMLCALASSNIEKIDDYLKVMAWAGTITAVLAILQKFGFNQFWAVKPTSDIGTVANPEMVSFIGQPTLTAAFICLCLLPAIYLKKYWMLAVMCGAVVLTGSAFGKLGIIASVLLYLSRGKLSFFLAAMALIAISAVVMLFVMKITDHGRIATWLAAIEDLKRPVPGGQLQFGFLGYGAGAFHYANQLMHNSKWVQLHNEFIEFMFNNGTIGILVLLAAIGTFFKQCLASFYDKEIYILLCMFIVACIIACGTFIWQLAVGQFYTVAVLGLAYNRLRRT